MILFRNWLKLRDPIPGDLVRRNGGFDRTHGSGWHVVTPQTPDLEALKSKTSAYRRVVVHVGISTICDQPDPGVGKRTRARFAGEELDGGFLRDSNLDPIPWVKKSGVRYRVERSWILVIRSQLTSHLFSSFPSPRHVLSSWTFEVAFIHDVLERSAGRNLLDEFDKIVNEFGMRWEIY